MYINLFLKKNKTFTTDLIGHQIRRHEYKFKEEEVDKN